MKSHGLVSCKWLLANQCAGKTLSKLKAVTRASKKCSRSVGNNQ